jgi:hypothetical protein
MNKIEALKNHLFIFGLHIGPFKILSAGPTGIYGQLVLKSQCL